jgi:aerobic C4-dicarboxylate transport protein
VFLNPPPEAASSATGKPIYANLWFQVSVAMVLALLLGYLSPAKAVAMKPLGDAFIRLISMVITLIIFCTVVPGIAGMQDMRKIGSVGARLFYLRERKTPHFGAGI